MRIFKYDGKFTRCDNRWRKRRRIIGGFDLGREYPELEGNMLIAITEQRTKEEIDRFAAVLEGLL